MKRHEYLYSAIILFIAAVIALAGGLVIHFLKPENVEGFEVIFYDLLPIVLYILTAFFVIMGSYALYNEKMIENGETIVAKVTGVKEYFTGKGKEVIHYNLFCEWKDPATKRKYKYRKMNMLTDPSSRLTDGTVAVRISKKDPRQYFIDL